MKKIVSVCLAALMIFSLFGMIAAAADDGFTPAYTVRVAPSSQGMILVKGIENETNTVPQGGTFYFTIEYQGSYRPDPSVLVKCYPASYPGELVGTAKDVESITLTPDEYGVYTIKNLNEDYYVGVYNATTSQFTSIKTMLMGFFQAILNFFKQIFNR